MGKRKINEEVFLNSGLIKTSITKMYEIDFFEMLCQNMLTTVCACVNFQAFFYLTPLSTAFEKVCGGETLTSIFGFWNFSQRTFSYKVLG